jgi:hypothetical protein
MWNTAIAKLPLLSWLPVPTPPIQQANPAHHKPPSVYSIINLFPARYTKTLCSYYKIRSDQIRFVHLGSNVEVGRKLELRFEGRPILNSQKQSRHILQFCFVGVIVSFFFFFFFTSLHDYCMRTEKNVMDDLHSPKMWWCHLISSHRGGAWAICFFCYCSYNSQSTSGSATWESVFRTWHKQTWHMK